MLNKYKNLKNNIKDLELKIDNKTLSLESVINNIDNLNLYKQRDDENYEKKIEEEIENLLNEEKEKISPKYQKYLRDLEEYNLKVNSEINYEKIKLKSGDLIEESEYLNELKNIKSKHKYLEGLLNKVLDTSLITAYGNVFKDIEISEKELTKIDEWLKYFKDYDNYDRLIDSISEKELKIREKLNGDVFIYLALFLFLIIISFRYYSAFIFYGILLSTLYIRLKEFISFLKVASLCKYFKTITEKYDNTRSSTINDFILKSDSLIYLESENLRHEVEKIKQNIEKEEKNKKDIIEKEFDKIKAKETAEENIQKESGDIDEKIEEEILRKDLLSDELEDLNRELNEMKAEMVELKETIKNTFEELQPSFKNYDMLEEFFLGFDEKDEPVTFRYKGDPILIVYNNEKEGELNALMSTIIMMCGQIMASMSPLAYRIQVVDTYSGGAPLSSFQITSDSDDQEESDLFNIIATADGVTKHIDLLYNEYQERRIKILGSFNNIKEYNIDKINKNARTTYFSINIFYEYDYKILTDNEKLKQLCRVGKDIGILLIFAFDSSKIESEKRTPQNKSTNIYNYKNELLDKLEVFSNSIYGFKVMESVDIVESNIEELKKQTENNI